MAQVKNPNRVFGEIELLSSHFGDVGCDPDDLSAVFITRFNLPLGFNRSDCELLIDLGRAYPEFPPQDWYLSKGLRKRGSSLSHYFESGFRGKRYCEEGLAWYSFHIKRWKPDPYSMIDGDNLLTAVNAFYHALQTD